MPAPKLWGRIKAACLGSPPVLTDVQRAQALIAAKDAGGIPLNAARIRLALQRVTPPDSPKL